MTVNSVYDKKNLTRANHRLEEKCSNMGSTSKNHIVMLPYMAHGHLIPFLGLAREIQQRTGFTITIANTPLNIQYLRSTISNTREENPSNIRLAEMPFSCTQHGLPPNAENTENLPLSDMIKLFYSSLSLKTPFQSLISEITEKEGRPPICIISDVICFGWVLDVANSFGIKKFSFATGGAYGTLAYTSTWLNLPHLSTDSDEFPVPGFPESYRFHRTQLHRFFRAADGNDLWSKFFRSQMPLTMKFDGWLCNTVKEIEPSALDFLRKFIQHPVWTIGPLIPSAALDGSSSSLLASKAFKRVGKESGIAAEECVEWLNSQAPRSVLYISFGSQNTIAASQMMALASGLESSETPFIWVVRPPLGFDMRGHIRQEWLPQGYEDRMKESKRGLLVRNWAPQLEILSHKSTGAFLSHCGWNSVLESLSRGVPIIGWPLAAEQAYNSKMLAEEMGVSVEIARTAEAVVTSDEVKNVIELVMDKEGKGGEMKKKAAEVAEQITKAKEEKGEDKGSSVTALDHFIKTILSS